MGGAFKNQHSVPEVALPRELLKFYFVLLAIL